MPEHPSREIDWSDPWAGGGEFLFWYPGFLQAPPELENLIDYYLFGRDPDDDVTVKEFILRESPTARRSLKEFYESGEHPQHQPDDLERRYLALPDDGEASWFAQRLPTPTRARRGTGPVFSEERRERWRRQLEERTNTLAAERGVAVEVIEAELLEKRRQRESAVARRERAEAKRQGVPVKELREGKRREREERSAETAARNRRLWSEWEARKAAIRAERLASHH